MAKMEKAMVKVPRKPKARAKKRSLRERARKRALLETMMTKSNK
jgi:hypothetical protein